MPSILPNKKDSAECIEPENIRLLLCSRTMKRVWSQAFPFRTQFLAVPFYSLLHVLKAIFHFSFSDYSSYAFPISALHVAPIEFSVI